MNRTIRNYALRSSLRRGPIATLRPALDTINAPAGAIRILRLAQVLDVTGLGKTKIYEFQSRGTFPMRAQITDHSVRWVEAEVQTWLAKRIAMSASLPREPTGGSSAPR